MAADTVVGAAALTRLITIRQQSQLPTCGTGNFKYMRAASDAAYNVGCTISGHDKVGMNVSLASTTPAINGRDIVMVIRNV
jgi:hypothetical protein